MKELPTWVFVAGPYRSGSTTQYRIARDIVEETRNGKGIGYHTEERLRTYDVPGGKKYVICKVFEFLPDGFKDGPSHGRKIYVDDRMKTTVTVRDPRDIIVSMRRRAKTYKQDYDFEQWAKQDFPVWLGNVEKWLDLGNGLVYMSRFEDFIHNLLAETRRIAEFLDIELEDKHAKDIAARFSIRAQQDAKEAYKKAKPDAKEDKWLPSIPEIIFGTSGHYTTWLNRPEQRMIEEANADFMRRFGYLEGGE